MVDTEKTARASGVRMMKWIMVTGVLMVLGALFYVSRFGPLTPAVIAATAGGVFISVLLGCGLFAVGFYSDKSGHDDLVSEATPGASAPVRLPSRPSSH